MLESSSSNWYRKMERLNSRAAFKLTGLDDREQAAGMLNRSRAQYELRPLTLS
jgi:hypothetical protein